MPKAVYVKIDDSDDFFLKPGPVTAGSASQPAGPDLRGVLAITPQARPWRPPPPALERPPSLSQPVTAAQPVATQRVTAQHVTAQHVNEKVAYERCS